MVKNPPDKAGDTTGDVGSILGSGRSPAKGNGNQLQCSCLKNPMTEEPMGLQSWTRLSDWVQHYVSYSGLLWVVFYNVLFNIYHSLNAPGYFSFVSCLCSPPESNLLEAMDLSLLIYCVSTSSTEVTFRKCSITRCSTWLCHQLPLGPLHSSAPWVAWIWVGRGARWCAPGYHIKDIMRGGRQGEET